MCEYRYLLALGSNLGDRVENLKTALFLLEPFLRVLRQSPWQWTKPLRHATYKTDDHEDYVNFVCEAVCLLDPTELYQRVIVKIEDELGHCRAEKWRPRQLDIDILFAAKNDGDAFFLCSAVQLNQGNALIVPHKDYFDRLFWRQMVEEDLKIPFSALEKHFLFKKKEA